MRNRILLSTLLVTLAVALPASAEKWDNNLAEVDETTQSVQLSPGTTVRVQGINGPVVVESGPGNKAEIHIVRSARTRADLEYHKIDIENTPSGLTVKGRDEPKSRQRVEVRQRVRLTIPRDSSLVVTGVNGRVEIGEMDAEVQIEGVNGSVKVRQARGHSKVSGVNGSVSVFLVGIGEKGIQVDGVNGSVDLHFGEQIDADLVVSGINGSVIPDLDNVTVRGKIDPHSFKAQIGAGGTPIRVSGVNGSVRLDRGTVLYREQ